MSVLLGTSEHAPQIPLSQFFPQQTQVRFCKYWDIVECGLRSVTKAFPTSLLAACRWGISINLRTIFKNLTFLSLYFLKPRNSPGKGIYAHELKTTVERRDNDLGNVVHSVRPEALIHQNFHGGANATN